MVGLNLRSSRIVKIFFVGQYKYLDSVYEPPSLQKPRRGCASASINETNSLSA